MEIAYTYRDFSVMYSSMTGTTRIYDAFGDTAVFPHLGESAGRKKAEAWIDAEIAHTETLTQEIRVFVREIAISNSMDGAGI